MVVNNNIPALQTYNAVTSTTNSLQKSIQKLSTGLRINSAADDAAGLAISEKMRAQVRGLDRAVANSQDGISMLQTAEGALSETHSILQRMRELSVQAANDTLTQQDRAYIQLEIDELRDEVTRIGNTTQFNKKKLLDGSAAALWSSDKLSTKALINGGLRSIDQFGQKTSAEGNFVIDINATAGKAQVQKSDVFTIKHPDVIMNTSSSEQLGINGVAVNNLPAGDYQVTLAEKDFALVQDDGLSADQRYLKQRLNMNVTSLYGINAGDDWGTVAVTNVDKTNNTLTLTFGGKALGSKPDDTKEVALKFDTQTGKVISGQDTLAGEYGIYIDGSIGANFDIDKVRAGNYKPSNDNGADQDLVPEGTAINVRLTGDIQTATPDTFVSFGELASGASISATSSSTLNTSLTTTSGVTPAITFNNTAASASNAAIAKWIAGNTGYDEVYARIDITTVGNPTNAVVDANEYTISLIAKSSTNSSLSEVTLASKVVKGGALTQTGDTYNPTADVTLDGGGVLSGALVFSKDFNLKFHDTSKPSEVGQFAEFKLQGVDLNAALKVTNDDDGGSKALAKAFADAGFDFSELTAGGHEISFRAVNRTGTGTDLEFGIVIDGEEDKATMKVTAAGGFALTTTDSTHISGAGTATNPYKIKFSDGTTSVLTMPGGGTGTDAAGIAKAVAFIAEIPVSSGGNQLGNVVTYRASNDATLVGRYGTPQEIEVDGKNAKANASILFEVTDVNDNTKSVTFKTTANILKADGSTTTRVANITLTGDYDQNLTSVAGDAMNLLELDIDLNLNAETLLQKANSNKADSGDPDATISDFFKRGDKLVYNLTQAVFDNPNEKTANKTTIQVQGQQNAGWDASWKATDIKGEQLKDSSGAPLNSVTFNNNALYYNIDAAEVKGSDVHFKNFYVNEDNGTVYTGDIVLSLAKNFDDKITAGQTGDVLTSFTAAYVGQVAKGDVKLQDLDKFWNSEGRSLLKDPQKLTISQGNGATTTVTLYATDTLNDAATKLNDAIAHQLGQMSVLSIDNQNGRDPAASSFVTFVDEAKEGTSEALEGTFVIRSAIAGSNSKISFAGDEELINKLSLNTLQSAEENSFSVSVWDAHTNKSVASSVKITGNKLIGVVNENVDVVFDAMANVKVEWNEASKSFSLTKDEGSFQTILHLADNTTVFQIGANEGEDMGVNFGDMRSEALGLEKVLVTDRESAARSITIIDNAIDKVSMQRAKIGAYQNRLEHTITNLTVAGENLTAAESRIRDTDMAKEMMNFTKLQIMLQAGTSMLAQANTLPQNVLSLLR
jgi:flagellin-like hook-associated protein FlgL